MPSRATDDLHPNLKPLCKALLRQGEEEGIHLLITCTYRSPAEQERLWESGRTKPGKRVTNARAGQSKHNYELNGKPASLAFDIAIRGESGQLIWDTMHPCWRRVGEIGKSLGLVWGGDFKKLRDYPHFELKL